MPKVAAFFFTFSLYLLTVFVEEDFRSKFVGPHSSSCGPRLHYHLLTFPNHHTLSVPRRPGRRQGSAVLTLRRPRPRLENGTKAPQCVMELLSLGRRV